MWQARFGDAVIATGFETEVVEAAQDELHRVATNLRDFNHDVQHIFEVMKVRDALAQGGLRRAHITVADNGYGHIVEIDMEISKVKSLDETMSAISHVMSRRSVNGDHTALHVIRQLVREYDDAQPAGPFDYSGEDSEALPKDAETVYHVLHNDDVEFSGDETACRGYIAMTLRRHNKQCLATHVESGRSEFPTLYHVNPLLTVRAEKAGA